MPFAIPPHEWHDRPHLTNINRNPAVDMDKPLTSRGWRHQGENNGDKWGSRRGSSAPQWIWVETSFPNAFLCILALKLQHFRTTIRKSKALKTLLKLIRQKGNIFIYDWNCTVGAKKWEISSNSGMVGMYDATALKHTFTGASLPP